MWFPGPRWYIIPRGDLPPANQFSNFDIALLDTFVQIGGNEEEVRELMMFLQNQNQMRLIQQLNRLQL